MEVILREDIPELGRSGDVVNVSPGYARNYLIPQSLATKATRRDLKQLEHQKRIIAKRAERKRVEAATLSERMQDLSITVPKPVGGNDRLYGSVTPPGYHPGVGRRGARGRQPQAGPTRLRHPPARYLYRPDSPDSRPHRGDQGVGGGQRVESVFSS